MQNYPIEISKFALQFFARMSFAYLFNIIFKKDADATGLTTTVLAVISYLLDRERDGEYKFANTHTYIWWSIDLDFGLLDTEMPCYITCVKKHMQTLQVQIYECARFFIKWATASNRMIAATGLWLLQYTQTQNELTLFYDKSFINSSKQQQTNWNEFLQFEWSAAQKNHNRKWHEMK